MLKDKKNKSNQWLNSTKKHLVVIIIFQGKAVFPLSFSLSLSVFNLLSVALCIKKRNLPRPVFDKTERFQIIRKTNLRLVTWRSLSSVERLAECTLCFLQEKRQFKDFYRFLTEQCQGRRDATRQGGRESRRRCRSQ